MPFPAQAYKVMIASPSDVVDERKAAREVLHAWNDVHSAFRKIVLLPVGWETNTTPTMGGHPQEIINKQILQDADILIGIFWTRLGTSTTHYKSGTVEVIRKHTDAGKTAKLYFSDSPVHPSSVDPKQYEELKKFKMECQQQGLLETFSGLGDFRLKFERHLQLELNRDVYSLPPQPSQLIGWEETPTELTDEASRLLQAGVTDRNGNILQIKTMDSHSIQTGNEAFIEQNSPRSAALWVSALEELVTEGLIRDVGYKGEIYAVTNNGYKVAERLEALSPLQVNLSIEGTPPDQVLSIKANKTIRVDKISYTFSNNGHTVASQDLSLNGSTLTIPINNDLLLALWNAPRPDKAHWDHSGPATVTIALSEGKLRQEVALPVLLDSIMLNNTMFRRVAGSKLISF